jgi:hypothetical protein
VQAAKEVEFARFIEKGHFQESGKTVRGISQTNQEEKN